MASFKPNMSSRESESGASMTLPKKASALRVGDFLVVKDRPCKILELSTHKTGKHGSAKVSITGLDLVTGRKMSDMHPSTAIVYTPVPVKREFQLLGMAEDGWMSLLDLASLRPDMTIRAPEGTNTDSLRKAAKEHGYGALAITVTSIYGFDEIKSFKQMQHNDD